MKYLKSTIAHSAILLIAVAAYTQEPSTPNILEVMTDQQAWDVVGYSGNSNMITPNLDKQASEGVNFSQTVTPCSVCVPARTSILTGR
ncbi:MAG: sulfatase-like hydrolase/transferase [Bacteroidales bacterium]|nr:sulfatase-like hydrolase/transferase [Bacteroidales bacterium]MCF8389165.1 sulfatase-like hydrolase/transferase [Bacteroidales bacterium]